MTTTNPLIYGQGNLQNRRIWFVTKLCLENEAATQALVAFGRLAMYIAQKSRLDLSKQAENEGTKKIYSEALYHLNAAISAMNAGIANTEVALSEASVNAASLLGACGVGNLASSRRSRFVNTTSLSND
jgi:hypothetical protein